MSNTGNLSSNSLQRTYDLIQSLLIPVYYAMSEYLEQGKVWKVAETKYFPEYIAFHPADLETIKSQLPSDCKLVPLKDAPIFPLRLNWVGRDDV